MIANKLRYKFYGLRSILQAWHQVLLEYVLVESSGPKQVSGQWYCEAYLSDGEALQMSVVYQEGGWGEMLRFEVMS